MCAPTGGGGGGWVVGGGRRLLGEHPAGPGTTARTQAWVAPCTSSSIGASAEYRATAASAKPISPAACATPLEPVTSYRPVTKKRAAPATMTAAGPALPNAAAATRTSIAAASENRNDPSAEFADPGCEVSVTRAVASHAPVNRPSPVPATVSRARNEKT